MALKPVPETSGECKYYQWCCNCPSCQQRARLFQRLRKQGVPETEAAQMAKEGVQRAPRAPRQPWHPRRAA